MDTLLPEIETFIAENGIRDSAFGEAALGDRHFVRQLREGREPRRATVDRARAYMATFERQAA